MTGNNLWEIVTKKFHNYRKFAIRNFALFALRYLLFVMRYLVLHAQII